MLIDVIKDTLLDAVKLIPFLFFAFLLVELFEHKFDDHMKKAISKSGKFGPLYGALLGAIPQCGFSVLASNLYSTRIITLGTLISIYLSTSDEMIPILISSNAPIKSIILIVGFKVVIGFIMGMLIDLFYKNSTNKDFEMCEDDHCGCEDSIIKSSIIHTLKTLLFIIGITFILNLLFANYSNEQIGSLFLKDNVFAPFLAALLCLIPNCGPSIVLTELYLNGVVSIGTCIGGLLTGSGLALLVLFKNNHDVKENIKIILIVYFIGSIVGLLLNIFNLFM